MLSHVFSLVPQSFTHIGVSPCMLYSNVRYWKVSNGIARQVNIISKFSDDINRIFDITHSNTFDIGKLMRTHFSIKDIVTVLKVYKPTYEECKDIMVYYMKQDRLFSSVYDECIKYYPQLSSLINEETIRNTLLHHRFPHLPISMIDVDTLYELLSEDVEEFLYVYPAQDQTMDPLYSEVINKDIRAMALIIDYPQFQKHAVVHWRLYGTFPDTLTDITDFSLAYYVRKHDPEFFRNCNVNPTNIEDDFLPLIDTTTDLEIVIDVLSKCNKDTLESIMSIIRDMDSLDSRCHWINTLLYAYGYGSSHPHIILDNCSACKHFIHKMI